MLNKKQYCKALGLLIISLFIISCSSKGPKDCGEDFDCFIDSVETCAQSKLTQITEMQILTFNMKSTMNYEIKGQEGENCIFYLKNVDIEYTPNKNMVPLGVNEQDLNKQMDEMNKIADDSFEGKEGTCKISKSDLTQILERWNNGKYSTDDFKEQDCEGEYFEMNQNSPLKGNVELKDGELSRLTVGTNLGEECSTDEDCGDDVCWFGKCVECVDERDCEEGSFCHGFDNVCISNKYMNQFSDCQDEQKKDCGDNGCFFTYTTNCDNLFCENCESDKLTCLSSTHGSASFRKCVECGKDSDCKEGYSCLKYLCVKD